MTFLIRLADLHWSRCLIMSLLVGLAYYLVGYDDGSVLQKGLVAATEKMTKIEEELAKLDKQLEEIRILKNAQERDAERLNALMAFIPEKLTKTDLMRTLSNEAKTVGVNINSIRDSAVSISKKRGSDPTEFYEEISVEVDLVGDFPQLVLFLANLTRLNQILSVERLALKPGSLKEEKQDIAMSAKILGYRYLGAEEMAKIEEARKAKQRGRGGRPGAKK